MKIIADVKIKEAFVNLSAWSGEQMNLPQVSIIIPCYNAERYVGDAIESALSQKCTVQVIVVDDGSTDRSAEVVERYVPAVQLVRTPNHGIACARNVAIDLLKAPYALLLDNDDRLNQDALCQLLSAMQGSQQRVVYGRFQGWNHDMTRRLAIPRLASLKPHPFEFLSCQDFTPPGAVLFPTSAFDKVGKLDQAVAGCDDWDFLMRLARAGLTFHGINKVVFHYRRLASSASNRPRHMLDAGLEVIRRAHHPDVRVHDDNFPTGLPIESLAQKQFLWGADCFALAAVRGISAEIDDVFANIPVPPNPCWETFTVTVRKMLVWHCQPYRDGTTDPFRDGLIQSARYLKQRLSAFDPHSQACKSLIYPDFTQLIKRPGPRKAVRLWSEWRAAKSILAAIGDDPDDAPMSTPESAS